jgi:hypothetical protein
MAKKKKIGSVGRNEILFYFEIVFFDKASSDTTVDPLAVSRVTYACFIHKQVTVYIMEE